MINWKRIFGSKKTMENPNLKQPYEHHDALHLWEDDYLMMELLPTENLDFLKTETKRIGNFSNEHYDGSGFTEITAISEKPLKTIDRKIPIQNVVEIFSNIGFEKIEKIVNQGEGLLEPSKMPLCYGNKYFAIVLEQKDNYLEHIWITREFDTDLNFEKAKFGFMNFATQFDFIAVNWFLCSIYDLKSEKGIEDFLYYNEIH